MPKYWIYVLENIKDKWIYVGHTVNLQRRLEQHNSGRVKPTCAYVPFRLAYVEGYRSRSEAMKRERFLKSGVGRVSRGALIARSKYHDSASA